MAILVNIWLSAEKLEQLAAGLKAKGKSGVAATIAVNDEINDFGQNAVAYIAPSKEDKEKGKKPFYFGNGKCVFAKGRVVVVKYENDENVGYNYVLSGNGETQDAESEVGTETDDGLPF